MRQRLRPVPAPTDKGVEAHERTNERPTHSSGTSYGRTRGRPAADPSPENSSKRLFPKTRYTMRVGPYQLDPRKGTITTWIRRDRIPNEKTPGHEATNKSSVPYLRPRKGSG
ncbi:hypothetical protein EVAR_38471_1 [Eumeta japonica]|uniref:Uncharacterized protein n=1 Tax=Eumeta variegata TaxID=151549 RepID=A0A4C1WQC9_EUMVA|nr:hypothetical protein EVAR_38471_1 [Eumeta japonica]